MLNYFYFEDLNDAGTEDDPYQIATKDDLRKLSDYSNSGADLTGVYFKQMQDIDLETNSANPWIPVSTTYLGISHQFTGVYDGCDHNITGMYVNKQSDDDGFFGYIGKGGVLRHVNVVDGYVDGTYWAGGIAERNYGTIEYCSFSGKVHGSQDFVGGIVGDNHTGGVVRFCYTTNTPNDDETSVKGKQIAGGIAGRNSTNSVIENCYNKAYVSTDDDFIHNIGGITGKNEGGSSIDNCYNIGYIEGLGEVTNNVGAIAGQNDYNSSVTNCFYKEAGDYTAIVKCLNNPNYTIVGAQNTEQPWHILEPSATVSMSTAAKDNTVTYGEPLDITFTIDGSADFDSDTVEFRVNGGEPISVKVNNKTAKLTVDALSSMNFLAGANVVTAEISDSRIKDGKTAITVTVNPKKLTATISGDTTK